MENEEENQRDGRDCTSRDVITRGRPYVNPDGLRHFPGRIGSTRDYMLNNRLPAIRGMASGIVTLHLSVPFTICPLLNSFMENPTHERDGNEMKTSREFPHRNVISLRTLVIHSFHSSSSFSSSSAFYFLTPKS